MFPAISRCYLRIHALFSAKNVFLFSFLATNLVNQYLVNAKLPVFLPKEFLELLPSLRAYVDSLLEKSILISYSLAGDRSQAWIIVQAKTPTEVRKIIQDMPGARWLDTSFHELAFHRSYARIIPAISDN